MNKSNSNEETTDYMLPNRSKFGINCCWKEIMILIHENGNLYQPWYPTQMKDSHLRSQKKQVEASREERIQSTPILYGPPGNPNQR